MTNKKTFDLVVKSGYSITTNTKILQAIDEYCEKNAKSQDDKAKIQIFTSLIYDRQLKYGKRYVQLPRAFFIKTFGQKNYLKIKTDALACSVDMVRNYSAKLGQCASYQIKKGLSGNPITFYPNCSDNLLRGLIRKGIKVYNVAKKYDAYYGDHRVHWQSRFLHEIKSDLSVEKVKPVLFKLLQDGVISEDTFHKQLRFFEAFANGYHHVSKPDLNGRLYSLFTYAKRECRDLIGSDYAEIDISNSHPFILGRLLKAGLDNLEVLPNTTYLFNLELSRDWREKSFKASKKTSYAESERISKAVELGLHQKMKDALGKCKKCALYTNYNEYNSKCNICVFYPAQSNLNLFKEVELFETMATSGAFYQDVVLKAETQGVKFKPLLHLIRDKVPGHKSYVESDITPTLKKAIVKKCFLFWMNGKAKFEKRKFCAYNFFETLFPEITQILSEIKEKYGYTAIHGLVTKLEADMVFHVVNEVSMGFKKMLVGTVHDAFYTKKSYGKKRVLTVLQQTAYNMFYAKYGYPFIDENHIYIPYKIREIKD
jgi:hypothetical protein